MKTSLNHLPQNKQEELKNITNIILQNCDEVEIIILFGSYARGNYKEDKDLKKGRKSGHVSDYDILAVTKTKEVALNSKLWSDISKKCKKLKLSADPRIISHDIQKLNIKLAEGQYFYKDIKKEGVMLHDSGNFKLAAERQLSSQERKRIAEDEFKSWFESAQSFYRHYEFSYSEGDYKRAAFMLHQSAEHSLKAILLVFTNYCPNEHYLEFLQDDIEEFYPEIKEFFIKDTKEQDERIRLLEYAYIGGRYDSDYYISKEDLKILEKDAKKLLEVTEKVCKNKITTL